MGDNFPWIVTPWNLINFCKIRKVVKIGCFINKEHAVKLMKQCYLVNNNSNNILTVLLGIADRPLVGSCPPVLITMSGASPKH